jgi:hypothetical protein
MHSIFDREATIVRILENRDQLRTTALVFGSSAIGVTPAVGGRSREQTVKLFRNPLVSHFSL